MHRFDAIGLETDDNFFFIYLRHLSIKLTELLIMPSSSQFSGPTY